MEPSREDGITSTAAIAKHPIHPMLIPFPLASLVGVLVTDLVYWANDDSFWSDASRWLLVAGVVTGVAAALFGLIDFLTIRRVRALSAGWIHALGNVTAVGIALVNLLLRLDDPAEAVLPLGLILSAVTAGILTVTGWYGGELSYRHKIGVFGEEP